MTRTQEFQSTLPRRERQGLNFLPSKTREFQSTLPRRERLGSIADAAMGLTISIHAPAKGATVQAAESAATTAAFQSTLPRRERLFAAYKADVTAISIHAPAKGATSHNSSLSLNIFISIHAPAKGATLYVQASAQGVSNFNPRSREGSDAGAGHRDACESDISIHAPAKGATTKAIARCGLRIFQSTLPRRERRHQI